MAVPVTITDLTTTVASNSPQGSDAIGTNADDYIRALSAILKESGATLYTATGTDTITFSTTPTFSAYASGQRFFVKAAAANTGAVTVNINTLGAKNVLKSGATALAAGDIPAANAHFLIEYDGTQFQLLNPVYGLFGAGTVSLPAITLNGDTDSGLYQIGANNYGVAMNGAKVLDIASTGLAIAGTLSASGTTTLARIDQSNGSINFSSLGNGSTSWQIGTQTALKPLDIFIGGSVRAQFSDTGLAVTGTTSTTTGMAVGGATAGAGGIAFPATAVAVADVNTLDDYEEGTWTPAITFGGASVGITYSDQSGSYTKIGNRVTINAYITLSSKGSSTGQALLTGMPFATDSGFPGYTAVSLRLEGITFANIPMAYTSSNSTAIILEECTNAGTRSLLDNTDFSNTSSLLVSCTYKTA